MTISLQEREERIRAIRGNIIDSVNKRVAETVATISVREKNLLLNDFEYASGKIHLNSTPEGIGIGAHHLCNGKCVFCLGGKPKLFSFERYKDFFEPKLGEAISKARYLNLCGFGELLLMPGVVEFIEYLNQKEPGVNKIFTTNGSPLMNNDVLTLLTRSRAAIEISLHASNRELHRLLTRLDTFDQIIAGIKQLASLRKSKENPNIVLVFLINTLNVENLPDFVEFAAGLGADEIICNYMTVFSRAHLKLSCFFKQEITNSCLEKAQVKARKLKMPVRLPPRFRQSPQPYKVSLCSDPWKYFYVENEGSILPCCNAGYHVGYLNHSDFETIWNGSSYKYLRSSLTEGSIHEWCRYCLKYNSDNINDIRSHLSFRPGFREKILKGYKL